MAGDLSLLTNRWETDYFKLSPKLIWIWLYIKHCVSGEWQRRSVLLQEVSGLSESSCTLPFTFEMAFRILYDCKIKDRFVFSSKAEKKAEGVGVYVREMLFCVIQKDCVWAPQLCVWSAASEPVCSSSCCRMPTGFIYPDSLSAALLLFHSHAHILSHYILFYFSSVFNIMPLNLRGLCMLAKQKNSSQFQDVSLFQVTCVILFYFLSSPVYSIKHQAKLTFIAWTSELWSFLF